MQSQAKHHKLNLI